MTATNHDDQLGEIYPTMLNELSYTSGVSFSRVHCCGRHDIGPCPTCSLAVTTHRDSCTTRRICGLSGTKFTESATHRRSSCGSLKCHLDSPQPTSYSIVRVSVTFLHITPVHRLEVFRPKFHTSWISIIISPNQEF